MYRSMPTRDNTRRQNGLVYVVRYSKDQVDFSIFWREKVTNFRKHQIINFECFHKSRLQNQGSDLQQKIYQNILENV